MRRVLGNVDDEVMLNDFADSAVGRSISEAVMREGMSQEISDMAKQAYMQFEAQQTVDVSEIDE